MFPNILAISAAESGFGFNSNILETNLVNILILLIGLFIIGRDFLGSNLSSRQSLIINNIKNADDKLNQALERLQEAKTQANQANLIYQEINAKALKEKLAALDEDYLITQQKIERQCESSFTTMNIRKYEVLTDIKNDVTANAIFAVIRDLETNFSNKDHERLINERIEMIKGLS